MQSEIAVAYSIARLAHKYQVRSVLEDAVSRLKSVYPDRLPDLIAVINGKASNISLLPSGYKDSLRVLELSRLLRDTSLLRSAYYHLAQDLPSNFAPHETSEELFLACAEDIARVKDGWPRLSMMTVDIRYATFELGSIECYESICNDARANAGRDCDWIGPNAFTLTEVDEYEGIICQACLEEMEQNEYRAMQTVWDELPSIFGFTD